MGSNNIPFNALIVGPTNSAKLEFLTSCRLQMAFLSLLKRSSQSIIMVKFYTKVSDNIPFNALIVGPTNSGKTQFLVNQLCGPFKGKFDYIVLICPTFAYNKTLYRFGERDPRLYVIICEQHHVEKWLKVASFAFEGTNTLIVLDDCAASKDVKGRTGELVKLGFSARHAGISVWVLTQQLSSIAKPFRENVAAIVLFYTPSAKTTKAIFEEYAGELSHEELKRMISRLKERKFAHLIFSLRFPFSIEEK